MIKKEDLRVVKTKKALYEGLLHLMKDKSFEEVKVSDICTFALTNRSTFYDHFEDKYDLLDSLIKDLKDDLTKKLDENKQIDSAKKYYMEMIKLFFEHTNNNIEVYSSILKNNNNSIVMDMLYETVIKDVEHFLEKNKLNPNDIPAEIISKFYVSGVINVCIDYIKSPKKYSLEDVINYIDRLLPTRLYD